MKAFMNLLKAEHLEHRAGQLWTPVVVAAILLVLVIFGMLHQGSMIINLAVEDSHVTIETVDDAQRAIRDQVGDEDAGPVMQALAFGTSYFPLVPILLIAIVASYFLLAGSMHNERVDRSVLFWKSMPVSDLKVTAAKFLSATFGTLLIAMAIGIALTLISLIIYALGGPLSSAPEWRAVAHPAVVGAMLLVLATFCVFYVLWAAPIYGWILLASAWAPRSPLLYVVIPPLALGIVEILLTKSGSLLWKEIGLRTSGGLLGLDISLEGTTYTVAELSRLLMSQIGMMAEGLLSLRLWVGLAIAALCIWAASEIRRRRIA